MTMLRAADSWWARFPDRRAAEDRAFAEHGAKVRVLNEASGLLIYAVDWPVEGEAPTRALSDRDWRNADVSSS